MNGLLTGCRPTSGTLTKASEPWERCQCMGGDGLSIVVCERRSRARAGAGAGADHVTVVLSVLILVMEKSCESP